MDDDGVREEGLEATVDDEGNASVDEGRRELDLGLQKCLGFEKILESTKQKKVVVKSFSTMFYTVQLFHNNFFCFQKHTICRIVRYRFHQRYF